LHLFTIFNIIPTDFYFENPDIAGGKNNLILLGVKKWSYLRKN
jgi:hypothetical protein